ncbi:hypothetical protein B0H17DRAFT_1053615 [Mycena rosella]|uniref:Uncharacterized protein n=1 Tax=Mycena rosella TaxID=1033263 RepID=A0AAD7DRD4_MYCRO|nr:hypothetical protein B0H17DRAFT_1053615 [Mycena rosella]
MLRPVSSTPRRIGGLYLRRLHHVGRPGIVHRVPHIDIAPHLTPTPRALFRAAVQAANVSPTPALFPAIQVANGATSPTPKRPAGRRRAVPKDRQEELRAGMQYHGNMHIVGLCAVILYIGWDIWATLRADVAAMKELARAAPDLDALPEHGPALARHLESFMSVSLVKGPKLTQGTAALAQSDPAAIRAACQQIHAVLQQDLGTLATLRAVEKTLVGFIEAATSSGPAEAPGFAGSDASPPDYPPLVRG